MPVVPIVIGQEQAVLRSNAETADVHDKELVSLVADLLDTVKDAQGIGLAAPQINISKRVIVAQIGHSMTPLINPDILWSSSVTDIAEEGCLSLPDVWLPIERSRDIVVRYTDEKGREQERRLSGLDARVVQHEVDHLNGVLITDYTSENTDMRTRTSAM